MTRTATLAQELRLSHIRRDTAGTGSRITTRHLSGNRLQVTEHNNGSKDVLVLDEAGHYAPLVTGPEAVEVAIDVEAAHAVVIATIVTGLAPTVLRDFQDSLTAEELVTLDSSVRAGRELQRRGVSLVA